MSVRHRSPAGGAAAPPPVRLPAATPAGLRSRKATGPLLPPPAPLARCRHSATRPPPPREMPARRGPLAASPRLGVAWRGATRRIRGVSRRRSCGEVEGRRGERGGWGGRRRQAGGVKEEEWDFLHNFAKKPFNETCNFRQFFCVLDLLRKTPVALEYC